MGRHALPSSGVGGRADTPRPQGAGQGISGRLRVRQLFCRRFSPAGIAGCKRRPQRGGQQRCVREGLWQVCAQPGDTVMGTPQPRPSGQGRPFPAPGAPWAPLMSALVTGWKYQGKSECAVGVPGKQESRAAPLRGWSSARQDAPGPSGGSVSVTAFSPRCPGRRSGTGDRPWQSRHTPVGTTGHRPFPRSPHARGRIPGLSRR